MKCLETRTTTEGFKRRRYESATGVRHTTIEVPVELWERINTVGSQRDRAAQAARALERESLKRQAIALVAAGKHKAFVGGLLNLSLRTVQRWTKA